MKFMKEKLPGIIFCVVIAALATFLGTVHIGSFSLEIVGAPVFAIITGMLITLIVPYFSVNKRVKSGIMFSSKKILQFAVIILGFSLNLGTIVKVGGKSLPIIVSTILTSLLVAMFLM